MALITCDNASFGYDRGAVVTGLSFSVEPGDYLCVVGENGSGKSTLLKGILRLKQPLTGTVATGQGLRYTDIGYLPQQTTAQRDFPAGVMEVVMSGRLNKLGWRPFYSGKDRIMARENMDKLGILDLRDKCYNELSGGQQQRVLLARALCATERLLLLDEPVSGLDPNAAHELYETIRELNAGGIAIIMVSHDISSAVRQAGLILHLEGRQVFFGKTSDYMKTGSAKRFFGGGEHA